MLLTARLKIDPANKGARKPTAIGTLEEIPLIIKNAIDVKDTKRTPKSLS